MLLCRVRLALGYPAAPDGEWQGNQAGEYEADVAYRRRTGLFAGNSVDGFGLEPVPEVNQAPNTGPDRSYENDELGKPTAIGPYESERVAAPESCSLKGA